MQKSEELVRDYVAAMTKGELVKMVEFLFAMLADKYSGTELLDEFTQLRKQDAEDAEEARNILAVTA
jgi:hypothetical protein